MSILERIGVRGTIQAPTSSTIPLPTCAGVMTSEFSLWYGLEARHGGFAGARAVTPFPSYGRRAPVVFPSRRGLAGVAPTATAMRRQVSPHGANCGRCRTTRRTDCSTQTASPASAHARWRPGPWHRPCPAPDGVVPGATRTRRRSNLHLCQSVSMAGACRM